VTSPVTGLLRFLQERTHEGAEVWGLVVSVS
jgi:hypothetical protein